MIHLVAEEPDFLVIEKPAGLLVHAAAGNPGEATLVDELITKFPEIKSVGDEPIVRPGIVHRLDKEASGLLVVARTAAMFLHLKTQFQNHAVSKEYAVLVFGRVKNTQGEINLSLGRQKNTGRIAARPAADERGREAKTFYEVTRRFGNATLLRVHIHTGRTHQIRAHLFALGHPVVGDQLYQPRRVAKSFPVAPRLFLHCTALTVEDLNGGTHSYHSPLPSVLTNYLQNFTAI